MSFFMSQYMHVAGNICGGLYRYTDDLLSLEASTPHKVSLPPECCHINSPLKSDIWESLLSAHPDRLYVNFLLTGIRRGLRVGCLASKDDLRSSYQNISAAQLNASVVDKYLKEELECGRLVEVPSGRTGDIHVSKLGVILKWHQPGKWRMIVDLSSPSGASTNNFINPSLCSLTYASVDETAGFILQAGRGAMLAKLDIKSAYRNVPVHPEDRHLLGICWQGRTFVDACLPFSLRSAPKIFNATADALEWIIANLEGSVVEFIIHYLDDFLFGGCPNSDSCGRSLDLVLCVCNEVGFPVMAEKVVGPTTVIEFLGLVLDTTAMEIRLPDYKLSHLKTVILSWKFKKVCTKHELLSLIDNLQHASSVVKPGRTFLWQMIDLSKRLVHLDGHLRLNTGFRADLLWWDTFLDTWNVSRC